MQYSKRLIKWLEMMISYKGHPDKIKHWPDGSVSFIFQDTEAVSTEYTDMPSGFFVKVIRKHGEIMSAQYWEEEGGWSENIIGVFTDE